LKPFLLLLNKQSLITLSRPAVMDPPGARGYNETAGRAITTELRCDRQNAKHVAPCTVGS